MKDFDFAQIFPKFRLNLIKSA